MSSRTQLPGDYETQFTAPITVISLMACVIKDICHLINVYHLGTDSWDNWNLNLIMNLNLWWCFPYRMLDNGIHVEFLILLGKGKRGSIIEFNYMYLREIYTYYICVYTIVILKTLCSLLCLCINSSPKNVHGELLPQRKKLYFSKHTMDYKRKSALQEVQLSWSTFGQRKESIISNSEVLQDG